MRRVYDGWARGDFTVGPELFDRHMLLLLDPALPDGNEPFVGMEGVGTYMRRFLGAWKLLTIEASAFRAAGDTVLVACHQTGTGLESGLSANLDYFQLWTWRGPKVVRLETIVPEADALRAAGLER